MQPVKNTLFKCGKLLCLCFPKNTAMRSISVFRSLLLGATVLGPICTYSQLTYTIDLSKDRNGTTELTMEPGSTLRVVITNRIPGKNYDISVVRSTLEIDPFPLDAIAPPSGVGPEGPCSTINAAKNAIGALTDENEVPEKVAAFRSLCDAPPAGCSSSAIQNLRSALDESLTFEVPVDYPIRSGQRLTIKIARKEGDKIHTWTHILSTEARGNWFVTYGFSFISDLLNKHEPYFAQQRDSSYIITRKHGASAPVFVPTVLVHWMPAKWSQRTYVPSFTGGLGFDMNSPTVFFGGSVTYNTNLGLHFGIAAHQQDRLRGIYAPGDLVQEALTEDQVNEKAYVFNPFISLSFRFSSDPFKSGKKSSGDAAVAED